MTANDVIEWYKGGATVTEIARTVGCSQNTITRMLLSVGVKLPKPPSKKHAQWIADYQDGMSSCAVAEKYGVTKTSVFGALKRAGVEPRSREESTSVETRHLYAQVSR